MLLPVTCPGCGARGAPLCRTCAGSLRPAPALPAPPGVATCTAVLAYDGPARELVARLKYRNHRTALDGIAAAMAGSVVAVPDVVTWAPTTVDRRRMRGFDHAELLARAVARRLGRPCRSLLERAPGPPQTGRTLAERRRDGPSLTARTPVTGRVLVVDDVVTSGATCAAAAGALTRAGAIAVDVVAAARTPPHKSRL